MSETLDLCIEEISRSIDSISTLYFKPPGIFHNAVVQHDEQGGGYSSIITKLIRDCDPKEELSLFKMDKQKHIHTRKDDKKGILDFLVERDAQLRRNRHVGIPDEKPIIQVPKEFYLKQHDEVLAKKRKLAKGYSFDVDSNAGSSGSNVYALLLSKFKDQEVVSLIHALQNGSVLMGEDNEPDRRKTMFVEDFPTEAILQVLREISSQWPLAEYKEAYSQYFNDYNNLNSEVELLKEELKLQEDQLETLAKANSSSSHVVTRLIEKERRDIESLEKELAHQKHLNETTAESNRDPSGSNST